MAPQHVRMLAYFYPHHGWTNIDLRSLTLEVGLDYKYTSMVLNDLEDGGLLDVLHGRNDAHPDGARSNSYRLTGDGRRLVPTVLRRRLTGNHALGHPMWAAKGYNLHGLMVVLSLGPGFHTVGSKEIAKILGCDRKSAIKRLSTWADRGWAVRMDPSTYGLLSFEEDPTDVVDLENYVPDSARRSAERKRGWVAQSRAAKRLVQDMVQEYGVYVPAAMRRIREVSVEVMVAFLDTMLTTADVVQALVVPPYDPGRGQTALEAIRRHGYHSY